MEMKILLELDWKITAPNAHLWIERLCRLLRFVARQTSRRVLLAADLAGARPARLQAVSGRGGGRPFVAGRRGAGEP